MASNFKKILLAILIFVLVILDLTALCNIIKGNKSDHSLEYAILLFGLAVFDAVFIYWAKNKKFC